MKTIIQLCIFCTAFFVVSCSDDSVTETEIYISENFFDGGTDASVKKLIVTSNADWQTKPSDDWYTVSPMSGKPGETEVSISLSHNLSGEKRTSKLFFVAGDKTKTVTLRQEEQLVLHMPFKQYTAKKEGGLINIVSDKKYEVVDNPTIDWITFTEVDGILKMKIDENRTEPERLGKIVLKEKGTDIVVEIMIIQESWIGKSKILLLQSLKIDDMPCVLDKTKQEHYFSVDMDVPQGLTHKLDFEGLGVDYITVNGSDTKIYSGESVSFSKFEGNTQIVIKTHNDLIEQSKTTALNITSLPIVYITAPEGIVDEPKRPCMMTFIDPKGRTVFEKQKGLTHFEVNAGIEWRGSGALQYPKKAFGFKLREQGTESSIDASLLGLRDDNNWILDAMWLDKAKMRNRICFDIWNEFNELYYKKSGDEKKAMSGTNGHLVEVFLDSAYHGLYVLSDKLDRKQLKLKKDGGYLYKLGDWTDECLLQGMTSMYNNNNLEWHGVEMDYPDEIGSIEFKYYADLITFVSQTSKEDFAADFENYIDVDNMIDCFIYTNLIMGYDNIGRNTFWGIYDIKKSTKLIPLIWDLDGTLGRTWDQNKEDPNSGWVVKSRHNQKSYRIYERILEENPINIHSKIKARWANTKDAALSPTNLNSKLDYYAQQQLASGAFEREKARWDSGYTDVTGEVAYIKDWYAKRWAKMDALINALD